MQGDWGRAGQGAAGVAAEGGPLVRARLSLTRTPWRIGPAWAVLAGAMAAEGLPAGADAILHLAAAVLLGDLVWGSLRQDILSRSAGPSSSAVPSALLPYAQPEAPLSRLLVALAAATGLPALRAWQPFVIGATLALGLSLLLGQAALGLTCGVVLLTAWAWLWRMRRGTSPDLAFAVLDVAAPGLLGISLAAGPSSADTAQLGALVLLAVFTALQYGLYRATQQGRGHLMGAWAGQIAVLAALAGLHRPLACAVVAALLALPSWWLARSPAEAVVRGQAWWWAAFLVAFLAPI